MGVFVCWFDHCVVFVPIARAGTSSNQFLLSLPQLTCIPSHRIRSRSFYLVVGLGVFKTDCEPLMMLNFSHQSFLKVISELLPLSNMISHRSTKSATRYLSNINCLTLASVVVATGFASITWKEPDGGFGSVVTCPDYVRASLCHAGMMPSVRQSTNSVIQQYPSSSIIARISLSSIDFLLSVSTSTCLVRDVRSSGSCTPCGRVQAMLHADQLMDDCTRIIATVRIPLFPSLDKRCGYVSSSWLSSPCSSIYTVTSVLTQWELDLFCSTYNILAELRPELPDRNSTIKSNPEGKIGMYTRFVEFANYRIPLSKFLLCILEYYQINLSQLSVIDALVCSLSLPWFDGTSVVKDPLPMDEAVDLPCAELLNENRILIRKYPKTFLCLVGLSRSFVEMDIGLLDFVKTTDPFKVKTGEWTLTKNEVPLLTEIEDRVIAPSSQPMSLVDHTIQDELNVNSVISDARPSTTGKSPSALQRLSRQNEQASIGSGSVAPVTEDVTSSSATPTTDFAHEDASHDNVRTRSAPGRFVVISSESTDADVSASPQVVPPMTLNSAGDIMPVAVPTGGDHPASGSGPEAGTLSATPSQGSSMDDFYESQTIDYAAA
ncbi:hypothetical protein Tco_0291317 [Tanacetum coccineum]